ncbi:hypothetical protein CFP65_5588 [Kitasatospora sp. MMS16-BH015]|uniref:hypothetical protein n=1 Tax=Kitasatospora sp. MMS16-BH015 TaxID=2018025 RepID=UPI000CA253CF|nr:hypothetical protein [Kitasatospora sp. MMS16-BH015]AUG80285.1 hypothetical protein CFP65_5588 [Kitasatospora sp. MMS16-BH015]
MTNHQRLALAPATALAALWLLTGCGSEGNGYQVKVSVPPPAPSASVSAGAQHLYAYDQAASSAAEPVAAYDRALTALAAHCLEQVQPLEDAVHGAATRLKALGSKDQTHLTVLRGVADSLPGAYPRLRCTPFFDTYVAAQQLTGTVH